LWGDDVMLRYIPLVLFLFIISSFATLATPTNSLAPDVNTSDVSNQTFLNRVFSLLREEDLFGLGGNTVDYHNIVEEGFITENKLYFNGDKIKKSARNGEFYEGITANRDEYDSLAIWRNWYRFREE
jgi:hypothetical protein